jgi:gliding motility-associated-like protein
MEPGFNFLTSSRGCAPFNIELQTLYLNSTPGTVYNVDWGDGSAVQNYTQVNAYPNGPIISHLYTNEPTSCGYQVIISVENPCNPLGSVVLEPINVIVWTDDDPLSNPVTYRVCAGFASSISFEDNSDWNCFPRADMRQNGDPRWIQWIYGNPASANPIPGVRVNGILPGAFPYYDPAPGTNPKYPVTAVDQVSLNVQVPVTAISDIGKDFYVTLNNWNTCNSYDENLTNGALNPITPGGDNPPRSSESRIVVVAAPTPDYRTRKDNSTGDLLWDFCIGDMIYFENRSTAPGGSSLSYNWEFYDGPTTADGLLDTRTNQHPLFSFSTGGKKLVRLTVVDDNAVGGCNSIVEKLVNITPTAIAQISASQTKFCKTPGSSDVFSVTFSDVSIGSTLNTEWKWEFYNEKNVLIRTEPASGYSSAAPVPYSQSYTNPGVYRVVLINRDIITKCDTRDEVNIVIYNNPEPDFLATPVCEGLPTMLIDQTVLQKIKDSKVVKWEWDFNYDMVNFNPDTTFDFVRPDTLTRQLGFGIYQVALRATNDQNGCQATFTKPVQVYQNPIASYTKNPLEGCSPLAVTLENTAVVTQPVAVSLYTWCIDYGSGYIDTLKSNPANAGFSLITTATFENWSVNAKYIRIALKTTSADGCVAVSAPDSVKVLPSVKPGFSYINYEPLAKNCTPVDVTFKVDNFTKSLNPTNYTWTISDANGIISQQTNTSNQLINSFTAAGKGIKTYSVNLKAAINDICVGDSTLIINVNPLPVSTFTIDTVNFDCDALVIDVEAEQKGLLEYDWTINRGGFIFSSDTVEDRFRYTILRPGPASDNMVVSINLVTSNYAFCESAPMTESLVVTPQPQLNARFMADPEIQEYPNAMVTLTNISTRSGAIHTWNYGDGTIINDEYPQPHQYARPGNYAISLMLEQDFCESTDTVHVYIQPTAPIADLSADPPQGCAPLTVQFTNLTKYGDPTMYRWHFGDGEGVSKAEHPSHTYYEPGIYSVKLEATNESGITDATVKRFLIEVFPVPHADFSVRPETVKLPDDPIYTTNLSFDADTYFWDFGDGSTSTEYEPSHNYTELGKYDIMLIAQTEKGCADTAIYESIVEVIEGNEIRIPNAFTPSLDGPSDGNRFNSGRNDVFFPVTEGVIAFHMQIYNRWGELLFDTADNSKGWDGYYKGRICPPDVYIYKIDFKFIDGREVMKFGDIALIR